jgi:spectinomycin phosphotransferase
VREPPEHVEPAQLLAVVRREWDSTVDELEHLPIGFGAHHWAASAHGTRRLFVTFDRLLPRHSAEELEQVYAAAAELAASGLDFVLAGRPTASGRHTVPLAEGALSVTAWADGLSGGGPHRDDAETAECAVILARLHASPAPLAIPLWRPLVQPVPFADALDRQLAEPWETGPYGEPARHALRARFDRIRNWAASYGELAHEALATRDTWVPTHGEPHLGNQLVTSEGRRLVDWESLKLAPLERDLRCLVDSGIGWARSYGLTEPDWRMVEMFDLEWRLSEIVEYAAWFSHPHAGTASDTIAFEGLREELDRDDWQRPRSA